jgi:hypothetical protein
MTVVVATLADVVLVVDVVVGAVVGDGLTVVVLAVAVGVVGCAGVWECRMVLAHNRS